MQSTTTANRHCADLAELQRWLRGIEFHDEDEDGIAEIELFSRYEASRRR